VGEAEDVGAAFALPDVGVDVGSSGIAALGKEGYAEMQPKGVKDLQTLGRPVASHQFIHDELRHQTLDWRGWWPRGL